MSTQTDLAPIFDYSLTGKQGERAKELGLVEAQWYASAIPRKRLKQLMRRRNGPALLHTFLWLAGLVVFGYLGYLAWGTLWAIPAFAMYGLFYSTACDSRWHECGHGTAFKTSWLNDVVYHIASFMVLREPITWRWSHHRHHTDTIIVGRDPEIHVPRPPDISGILLNLLFLKGGYYEIRNMLTHCFGRLTAAEKTYVPEDEKWKVFLTARIWVAIYAAVIASCFVYHTILPLMYIGLPSFYGAWLMVLFGLTQHAGLAENVLDHRLNCRTVYMNPFFRFLYSNMNYHLEHHMFPLVPYYNLPQLHKEIKDDAPEPYPSMWAAYKEIIPTLLRQRKDPAYHVKRKLPETAHPFPAKPYEALESKS